MWKRTLLLLCVSVLYWKVIEGKSNVTLTSNITNKSVKNVLEDVSHNFNIPSNVTNGIIRKTPAHVQYNITVPSNLTNGIIRKTFVQHNVTVPKVITNEVAVKVPIRVQQDITAFTNSTYSLTKVIVPSLAEMKKKVPGRIVNGTRASRGQFPQQVSLRRRYSQSHFCGGSILTPGWILTAGHCMYDKNNNILLPYSIIVVAGEIILKNINNAHQWSYVKYLVAHEKFDINTLENDIALLQLNTPFKFDPYVKPAPIPTATFPSYTKCFVSGWGYQKHGVPVVSSSLMYVDLPLLPIPLCRELMKNYSSVPPGMFCAGYLEGGKDACQGDSGGGMVCKGYLTGVVSGGEGCAWPLLPGLYSDVKYYVPWIKRYVSDLGKNFTVSKTPISNKAITFTNGASMLSWPAFTLLVVLLNFISYL